MKEILVVTGPTASGKTELAMSIYQALGGESKATLISVDSAMIYRGMDIGTAKPSSDCLASYPHSLIDIKDPCNSYSAADFVDDCDALVEIALDKGQIPILVGGTMLYIKCFRDGISRLPGRDDFVRNDLEERMQKFGAEKLYQELLEIDPDVAKNIHPNNRQRVLRALEVFLVTGKKLSTLWRENPSKSLSDRLNGKLRMVALMQEEKSRLHRRIEMRFHEMLKEGFLEEVEALRERFELDLSKPAMRAVGYQQAWRYLEGLIDRPSFISEAISATKLLAKKQMTWLRGWEDKQIITPADNQKIIEEVAFRAGHVG